MESCNSHCVITLLRRWPLQKVAHHPHASAPHVVNCVPSASSMIRLSLSVRAHQSGIPQTAGSRMYGSPPRDFVTPAILVRKPRPSSARHERRSRPTASALDHCLLREITSPRVLTKRRLVSDTPSHPRVLTKPRTRRRAHGSGRQPWAHVLATIQSAHANPARQRQLGGRLSGMVR